MVDKGSLRLRITGLLFLLGVLAGCSGIRPYPEVRPLNLSIRTETDSGSFFSNVRASVDIYRVDSLCRTEYQGTVKLDRPSVKAGIPAQSLSYMVFVFSSSSFLAGSKGTMSHGALLKARPNHTYDIKVSYKKDIYNVSIREDGGEKPPGREIEIRDMDSCGK